MFKFQQFQHVPHVVGYCGDGAFSLLHYYTTFHLEKLETFNTLELGVHHGQYFLALENLTPESGIATAVDVFGDQHKNTSWSGKGNINSFNTAVERFAKHPDRIQVIQEDTMDLTVEQLGGKSKYAMISIDASHTAAHTVNDLALCAELVTGTGIILLDDVFNEHFSGVITGAVKYFLEEHRIVPVAVGFGKLVCCHASYKHELLNEMIKHQQELKKMYNIKTYGITEFVGHSIVSFYGGELTQT